MPYVPQSTGGRVFDPKTGGYTPYVPGNPLFPNGYSPQGGTVSMPTTADPNGAWSPSSPGGQSAQPSSSTGWAPQNYVSPPSVAPAHSSAPAAAPVAASSPSMPTSGGGGGTIAPAAADPTTTVPSVDALSSATGMDSSVSGLASTPSAQPNSLASLFGQGSDLRPLGFHQMPPQESVDLATRRKVY